ncbi:MAG TPA: M50 family peptidase [Anaerolineae bacterium]|nr:M50 family peptidase [Anaerolineae bacterium]HIQ05305.1 M50 family peptidase [Anaerolineae bacterium]
MDRNVNISLAIFNALPIPGLDGFHTLRHLWNLIRRHKQSPADRPASADDWLDIAEMRSLPTSQT